VGGDTGAGDRKTRGQGGSVLVLAALVLIILAGLGIGMLTTSYGVRHQAIQLKNETTAMLAAEAGYEEALYQMSKQKDMLSALQKSLPGTSGTLSFAGGSCNYEIGLYTFIKARPVYKVTSNGRSGVFNRTVDVYVIQAIPGWAMGMCRVASGTNSSYPVHFADGEIIDMPVHINKLPSSIDPTDLRDIYISGEPRFLERVSMGESKYRASGGDKPGYNDGRDYDDLMSLFEDGIYFRQPDCRITDEEAMNMKIERFRDSTDEQFKLTPQGTAPLDNRKSAVQLEFFVEDGVGKVRITNNCTVRGYKRNNNSTTWDYEIKPGSDAKEFRTYNIYAYHVMPDGGEILTVPLEQTYVTQSFGGVESEPGGQIFINGNVVIGGHNSLHNGDQVVKGTVAVVATGNIWIADSIKVSDYDNSGNHWPRGSDDMPDVEHNLNAIGLIANGVIKVIDPGMSGYSKESDLPYSERKGNNYPGPPTSVPSGYVYAPVGHPEPGGRQLPDGKTYDRYLSDQTIVEAAVTVGGGGWGAENVERSGYGGRKEDPTDSSTPYQDHLYLRGAITESLRGVVGLIPTYYYNGDGYIKRYYLDRRLLEGILPGDIWLQGKYVATPAGWHDFRL